MWYVWPHQFPGLPPAGGKPGDDYQEAYRSTDRSNICFLSATLGRIARRLQTRRLIFFAMTQSTRRRKIDAGNGVSDTV